MEINPEPWTRWRTQKITGVWKRSAAILTMYIVSGVNNTITFHTVFILSAPLKGLIRSAARLEGETMRMQQNGLGKLLDAPRLPYAAHPPLTVAQQ